MSDERDLLVLREAQWRDWFPTTDDVDELLAAFVSFCASVVYIKHPQGRRLFELRDAQIDTARHLIARDDLIVLKARQIGFSTLIAIYSLWSAWRQQDFQVLMLSKGEREAKKLLTHATYAYNEMPEWVKRRAPRRTTDNVLVQAFANGAEIQSLPSKKDAARGYTGTLLVADEFAFLENPEEAWASMEPAADIGGQIMVLTTANGAGTLFEEMWNEAYVGVKSSMVPLFWSWREATERDDEWYAKKKNTMQTHLLHQEYPSSPEEAFIRSGRSVFDIDRLAEMWEIPAGRGYMLNGHFQHQADGEMWEWEIPSPSHEYVMGVDIAEGLEHGDASSAFVLDATTEKIVCHVWCHLPVDEFAQFCIEVATWYNEALMAPEMNNHGHAFIEYAKSKYPRMYRTRRYGKRRNEKAKSIGFLTSAATKPIIIDGLYTWLRTHNVPHTFTVRELRTFVRDEKGKMGGSPHDDRVMSLAIAVEMLKYVHLEEYKRTPRKPPKGSLAYYEKEWDKGEPKKVLHQHLVRSGS